MRYFSQCLNCLVRENKPQKYLKNFDMSKLLDEYVNNSHMTRSIQYLLKIRLWFYSLTFSLMVTIAYILLQIDFTVAKDPLVRLYHHNRWLLITSWFNLVSMIYTPICIYCDWRELQGTAHMKHVKVLNKFRFICFTSILFPSTCFSDILFWRLWIKNRDLVAPASVDVLVPLWLQHCLHTITLVVVILDLILMPRRRPKNVKFGVMLLTMFLAAYAVTCGRSIVNNQHIYPLLRLFSGYKFIPLVLFVSVEHYFYLTLQWLLVDLVWGRNTQISELMSFLRLHRNPETSERTKIVSKRKSRKDTLRNPSNRLITTTNKNNNNKYTLLHTRKKTN